MAISNFQQVCEFHKKFNHPVLNEPTVPFRNYIRLRLKLIAEELCELAEAAGWTMKISGSDRYSDDKGTFFVVNEATPMVALDHPLFNMIEWADALGDILYVTYGAAAASGVPINAVHKEINFSNFSKLFEGEPVHDAMGKIQKGPNYAKPNIALVLERQKRYIELGGTLWGVPTYDE